jgi:hypothetical protein
MSNPSTITDFDTRTADLPFVKADIGYVGDIRGLPLLDLAHPERTNLVFNPALCRIYDARPIKDRFSLDVEGFAFFSSPSELVLSPAFRDLHIVHQVKMHPLNASYHQDVCERLRELSGAREVVALGSGLILRTGGGVAKQSWAGPAGFAHLDFTTPSAHLFLSQALADGRGGIAPFGRFTMLQTWRVITPPPQPNTLAICDGRTVPQEEVVVMELRAGPLTEPGTCLNSRLCYPNPIHRWYYLSDMQFDEVMVFKGFDSAEPDSMNATHAAFVNPAVGPGAVPRDSIEARYFAFYD